jgi:hypothetical protein
MPAMAIPPGVETRGGLARRERLLLDLPAALEKEEARIFAAAKRIEATGDRARAALYFELSRQAYDTQRQLRESGRGVGDEDLERAHRLFVRLRDLH